MDVDFLVIGAGIIGISVARELQSRYPEASIQVVEKENDLAMHASGRNSGILHAGFYYTADSLKARFSRDGNRALTEYCLEHGLPINRCGKLVVAKNAGEDAVLDELKRRGDANGVELAMLSREQAREIEPRALTYRRALFSPHTASVDPLAVSRSFAQDAIRRGVKFSYGARYLRRRSGNTLLTSQGEIRAGYIVNCAGLYADRIARDFGFSRQYAILPFKGLYLYSNERPGAEGTIRTNIYPVPDLKHPFLGVHFTVAVDGKVKIGPTAIPALWREQYDWHSGFALADLLEVGRRQLALLVNNQFEYLDLAVEEVRKYFRRHMVAQATQLADGVVRRDYTKWGRPGIRAQLVDLEKKKLEMDFVLQGDGKSMHVLNAVSPAFTCSIPFSRYVCDQLDVLTASNRGTM